MNPKILIVDDKREYLQTAMNIIVEESYPYALLCAPNGKIALDIAIKEIPDIIIMDWEMPEMNGIEALVKLKNNALTKHIPVIMSTGIRLSIKDLKIAFDAGASDYLRKPLEKTEFIARIQSHLRMSICFKAIQRQKETLNASAIALLNQKIDTLEAVNQQGQSHLMFINQTLQAFLSKLESIDPTGINISQDISMLISKVRQSIQSLRHANSDINRPCRQFLQSYLQEHPKLTPGELQLSFMLRQGLSTKEIASLTFKEESSVKVSRSRLRKKLKLTESTNLVAYLDQF